MKLAFWPLDLRGKYLFFSTLILAIIVVYFTFDNTSHQEKVIKESFTKQAQVTIGFLEELSINHYYYLDLEALRFLLEDVKTLHNLTYAYYLDPKGRVLTDGTNSNIYKYKFLDDELSRKLPNITQGVQAVSKNVFDVLEPIDLGNERLGAVRLGFSLKKINQDIIAVRKRNFLIGVGLLLIFSLINYSAASYIVRPIKKLTLASYAVAEGNFSRPIKIDRKDELGQLEKAFNHMMRQVEISNHELSKARRYTEQIIQTISSILIVTDCKGSIQFANTAACTSLEYEEEGLLTQSIEILQTEPLILPSKPLPEDKYVGDVETHLKTKKGTTIPVWLQSSFLYEGKELNSIIWVARDISKFKQVTEALSVSENYQSAMIKAVPDLMFIFSKEGIYIDLFLDDTHPQVEPLVGKDITEVEFLPKKVAEEMKYKIALTARCGQIQTMEYTLPVPKEETHYEARLTSIDGERVLMLVRDITEHKKVEEALRYKALHDTLTGLANRANFSSVLQRTLDLCSRHPNFVFAVLLLDLDGFKHVNDSLGHIAGDEMLCEMSRRLRHCIRQQDTVARLGGDEFSILLMDIDNVHGAIQIAERIQEELAIPFLISDQEIFSSVSIGITLNTFKYKEPSEILRDADIALYRAKDSGKAKYEVFDSALHQQAVQRLQIASELRYAVKELSFFPHYQPIIDLKSQKITGFEALARWQRSKNNLEYPDSFIGVAEETQQAVEIDYIILNKACQQLARWQKETGLELSINTNLSGHQFVRSDLVEQIEMALKRSGVDSQYLHLEITESVLLQNPELASNMLNQLKSLGVKIYLDDFGTGYSSLSYLHKFPIDTLKLDRSFIYDMDFSSNSCKIVQAIIAMAQNLGISVVAEGIERIEHFQKLYDWGCTYGQGYFFSKPLDISQADILLTNTDAMEAKNFANIHSGSKNHLLN